ncbi:MAG: hypothetical protein ACPGWR_15180 [Ardenticatenaceae bacterium]
MIESQMAHAHTLQNKNSYDTAALAATLEAKGVPYLRTAMDAEPLNISLPSLISALAQHKEPRVRESLIPLFLRHPTLAQHVPSLTTSLPEATSQTLRHLYTAAVYLQRLWRGTLAIYLGHFCLLPEYFGQAEFGLPHPNEHFGELGLRVLANFFTEKTGDNWLSTYESVMSLTLAQLEMEIDDDH